MERDMAREEPREPNKEGDLDDLVDELARVAVGGFAQDEADRANAPAVLVRRVAHAVDKLHSLKQQEKKCPAW